MALSLSLNEHFAFDRLVAQSGTVFLEQAIDLAVHPADFVENRGFWELVLDQFQAVDEKCHFEVASFLAGDLWRVIYLWRIEVSEALRAAKEPLEQLIVANQGDLSQDIRGITCRLFKAAAWAQPMPGLLSVPTSQVGLRNAVTINRSQLEPYGELAKAILPDFLDRTKWHLDLALEEIPPIQGQQECLMLNHWRDVELGGLPDIWQTLLDIPNYGRLQDEIKREIQEILVWDGQGFSGEITKHERQATLTANKSRAASASRPPPAAANGAAKVAVFGGTGRLGGGIVQALRTKNVDAKVVSHQAVPQTADLRHFRQLVRALEGCEHVISTVSAALHPDHKHTIARIDLLGHLNLLGAAKQAGCKKITFVSFVPLAVEFPLQDAKRTVEAALEHSDLQFNLVRSTYFRDDWLAEHLGFAPKRGMVTVYGNGDTPVRFVNRSEVAQWIADAVAHGKMTNGAVHLGEPTPVTFNQVLDVCQKHHRAPLQVTRLPVDQLRQLMHEAADPKQKSGFGLALGLALPCPIDEQEWVCGNISPFESTLAYLDRLFAS